MPERLTLVRPVLVSAGELFGGVERHLIGLATYFRRSLGIDAGLVLFHDGELARQARALGLSPVILPRRHAYSKETIRDVAAALDDLGATVVHAHGYKALVTCALAKGRRPSRSPLIKTEHGRPEGRGAGFIASAKSRLNHAIDGWATRRGANAVVYVSDAVAEFYRRAHRGLATKVLYNGIDPLSRDDFARPAELAEDGVNMGIVGRLSAVKGISIALRALASPAVPSSVRLYVIGTGPLERSLREEAASANLSDRVLFMGFRRDVLAFIAHCHCLLMPSFHEGLPYTLLEAMSLGTPIIASRVGGVADLLRDRETALLVPPGDPDALGAAIASVAAQPVFSRSLGAAAAALQRSRYTLDAMGSHYWELYEACLARQPAAAGVVASSSGIS